MSTQSTKIVIIHDDIDSNDPLIAQLRDIYGKENVILIRTAEEGEKYVLEHISEKMVVILDVKFNGSETDGIGVFNKVRKQSSLIYIIIWTAENINNIEPEKLKSLVNNEALAMLSSTDDNKAVIDKVNEGVNNLNLSIANAIELWISTRTEEERKKASVLTRGGDVYSLDQILNEIRKGTDFGKETEKSIILLAIDLLARNKRTL